MKGSQERVVALECEKVAHESEKVAHGFQVRLLEGEKVALEGSLTELKQVH